MTLRRTARLERARDKRARNVLAATAALGAAAVIAAAALAGSARLSSGAGNAPTPAGRPDGVASAVVSVSSDASVAGAPAVEIPQVTGATLAEAKVVLEAAGLTVEIAEDATLEPTGTGDSRTVTSQDPEAGQIAAAGSAVRLTVAREEAATNASAYEGHVVCIDPGHQSRSDSRPEPLGPGATETKERVRGGTTGVETGLPECEVALQIAMNLKGRLEAAGVKVVMTRTVNDVNVSNAERAEVANKAGADLFVRIHGNGSPDPDVAGITTLFPASNSWTAPIVKDSRRAASIVQAAVVAATGATSRGVEARGDLAGFNWSRVPVILVECGFMTNPVEDKLLASPHYQDKLAQGIADGIFDYFGE